MVNRPRSIPRPEKADRFRFQQAAPGRQHAKTAIRYVSLKLHFLIDGVLIVLLNTEIPHGDLDGGMV